MEFTYTARDPLGHEHDGVLTADSQEDAIQTLRGDGMQVLTIEEDDGITLFPKRISKTDIIYMTSQLAIMVETGINLAQALSGLAEQEEHPTLKRVLQELKKDVEAGESFSNALAQHPKHFDHTFVALVKSSEQTGSLGAMLEEIANYLRKEVDNVSKVRSALAYPGIMAVLAVGVTIFLLTFIMPKFTPLFTRKGLELPKITQFVMLLSDSLMGYWYFWILGAVVLVAALLWVRRTDRGRRVIDWLRIYAPIIGPMFRKIMISRSIRTLGTMLGSGVSMLESIQLTAEVSGNYYFEKTWLHVLDQVTNGNRVCEALQGNPLFPKTLVQMIASGEETGKLDIVLKKCSTYYEREVDAALKAATTMIEPLMISVMGVVVGGIALSLMLPIFTLSSRAN